MSAATPVKPPGVFPPPPGVTPNFTNPPLRTLGLVPLICIFTFFSTVALLLRLYTKVRIIRIFGWEDVVVTMGWLCTVFGMGLFLAGLKVGVDAHVWDMRIDQADAYNKESSALILLNVPSAALPKIAILMFYLRLNPTKSFRYSTMAVLLITWGYLISFLFAQIFGCTPPEKFWKPLTPGTCIDRIPIYLAIPIANMLIDILVLILPIPMVINLQVPRRTKVVLGALFAVSSCTVVVSALRVWAITKVLHSNDFTWDAAPSDSIQVVELNMTVVCACVMVLRPFCRRHLPFMLGVGRTGDRTPDASNTLNFDGPSGPRSKSSYRTKVSGGGSRDVSKVGKRGFWTSLGSTLEKDDDEDMESLSTEMKPVPDRRRSGKHGENGNGVDPDAVGIAHSDPHDPYLVSREGDLESGIMKTVSLDVR